MVTKPNVMNAVEQVGGILESCLVPSGLFEASESDLRRLADSLLFWQTLINAELFRRFSRQDAA